MKSPAALALALLFSLTLSPSAHARSWLEKQIRHHASNIADAVTLGEAGRQRDEERRQAEARAAEERQRVAEQQKRDRIAALEQSAGTLGIVIRDFQLIVSSTDKLTADFSQIVSLSLTEFNQRSFLKNSLIPSVRNLWSGEAEYSAQLVNLLEESNRELADLLAKAGQPDGDAALKAFSESKNAFARLQEIAKANGQELSTVLQRSTEYLNEMEAGKLVAQLAQAEASLKKLADHVKGRKGFYESQLASVNAQLAELKK